MTVSDKPARKRRPTRRKPVPKDDHRDVDLTGMFRMDLRTILLLVALAAQWYDGRAQAEKQAAIQEAQNKTTADTLAELKRLQSVQGYDINGIKIQLAEAGIKAKKGE